MLQRGERLQDEATFCLEERQGSHCLTEEQLRHESLLFTGVSDTVDAAICCDLLCEGVCVCVCVCVCEVRYICMCTLV